MRTDGKGRVRIELMTLGGQFIPFTQVAEMIKQQWKKIGIDADVKETERGLAFTKTANAEHQILFFSVTGAENLFLFPRHALPVDPAECHLGMPFARWYASNGAQGKKPSNPEMLRAFELFRSAGGKKEAERIKIAKEMGIEPPRLSARCGRPACNAAASSSRLRCAPPSSLQQSTSKTVIE